MFRHSLRLQTSLVAILLVASLSTVSIYAQKGGGGPPGVVYFQSHVSGSPAVTGYVKADGTGNAVVVRSGAPTVLEASYLLQGGQRWFLGGSSNDILAAPETGNAVLLYSNPDFILAEQPRWKRNSNDGWITFPGTLWWNNPNNGQREIYQEGIFAVLVAYDVNGNIIGSMPGSFQLLLSTRNLGGVPYGHDWGPQGKLLFVTWDGGEFNSMWIADFSNPNSPQIVRVNTGSTKRVAQPTWSPNGLKIAFDEATTGIVLLTLSNGTRKTIKSTATTGVARALWSPTGDWIVYQQGRYGTEQSDVYRATSEGSSRTRLVTGRALGWRE